MEATDSNRPHDLVTLLDDAPAGAVQGAADVATPWRVLIVDDEQEVHHATSFALSGLVINGRGLEFIHAFSGREAREILTDDHGIAVILLDVVMETEDSGLKLVQYIRDELKLTATRIVLRTGQPGYAPEMQVIQEYDINDYKTKSELTRTRLATTMTTAIRSYLQLQTIEQNRQGLVKIIEGSADLFSLRGLESFSEGVLTQIAALLRVSPEGLVTAQDREGIKGNGDLYVVGAAGKYLRFRDKPLSELSDARIVSAIRRAVAARANQYERGYTTLYMRDHSGNDVAVFLDTLEPLSELDTRMIEVFCTNIAIGFENVLLFQRLNQYAYVDPLSGLPNRLRFVNLVDEQLLRERDGWRVAILDIDHFSETNDGLGHENGDLLLRSIAERLRAELPEEVLLARVSGDCFGLLGRDGDLDPDRVLSVFRDPFSVNGYSLQVSGSLGVVRLGETMGTGLDAFKNANIGLNRAKGKTRGRYYYYTPDMEADTRERMKLAHDLRRSIKSQQLMLFYQPQLQLSTGRVVGAEALLRWRNNEGRMVPPDKFIPVAEYSGLIRPIGEWVLRTACRQLKEWNEKGLDDFRVAVNVSMDQFRAAGFTELVHSIIDEFQVKPKDIELEITESMAMDEVEIVMATLRRLKEIGVAVAIDDFGTGFSSLGYLQQLDVDRLKIDRTFVNELIAAPGAQGNVRNLSSIPEMIIRLGHNLGLQVIAEGVETEEQAAALKEMGCDEGQGYLFGRPVDVAAFEAWLSSRGVRKLVAVAS